MGTPAGSTKSIRTLASVLLQTWQAAGRRPSPKSATLREEPTKSNNKHKEQALPKNIVVAAMAADVVVVAVVVVAEFIVVAVVAAAAVVVVVVVFVVVAVVFAGWDSSPPCNCLHFWHTRSCVSRHICAHAGQILSTPAQAHHVISARMLAKC